MGRSAGRYVKLSVICDLDLDGTGVGAAAPVYTQEKGVACFGLPAAGCG
jgi:hypothetical protein